MVDLDAAVDSMLTAITALQEGTALLSQAYENLANHSHDLPVASTDTLGGVMASASFEVGSDGTATVPAATESLAGIVERATNEEASAGTDTERYVTPYHLKNYGGAVADAYRLSRIGAPHFMASSTMPTGYMLADGALVLFEDYPELYDAYNAGLLLTRSSSSTYYPSYFTLYGTTGLYLPTLGGYFLRGWSSSSDGTAGYYNAAGLPNIEGAFGGDGFTMETTGFSYSGALSQNGTTGGSIKYTNSGTNCAKLGLDASGSNAIYGNSATVMPLSTNQPIAIYLGNPA